MTWERQWLQPLQTVQYGLQLYLCFVDNVLTTNNFNSRGTRQRCHDLENVFKFALCIQRIHTFKEKLGTIYQEQIISLAMCKIFVLPRVVACLIKNLFQQGQLIRQVIFIKITQQTLPNKILKYSKCLFRVISCSLSLHICSENLSIYSSIYSTHLGTYRE